MLRQYLYCPRKIYWRDVAKIPRPPTYLMDKGTEFHKRKSDKQYIYKNSLATYREFYIEIQSLRLKAVVDLVVEYTDHLRVVEYKHSIPIPTPKGYLVQLASHVILSEAHFNKPVTTVEVRREGGFHVELIITEENKQEVLQTRDLIEQLMDDGSLPKPCENKRRCYPCEYRRVCKIA